MGLAKGHLDHCDSAATSYQRACLSAVNHEETLISRLDSLHVIWEVPARFLFLALTPQ